MAATAASNRGAVLHSWSWLMAAGKGRRACTWRRHAVPPIRSSPRLRRYQLLATYSYCDGIIRSGGADGSLPRLRSFQPPGGGEERLSLLLAAAGRFPSPGPNLSRRGSRRVLNVFLNIEVRACSGCAG